MGEYWAIACVQLMQASALGKGQNKTVAFGAAEVPLCPWQQILILVRASEAVSCKNAHHNSMTLQLQILSNTPQVHAWPRQCCVAFFYLNETPLRFAKNMQETTNARWNSNFLARQIELAFLGKICIM